MKKKIRAVSLGCKKSVALMDDGTYQVVIEEDVEPGGLIERCALVRLDHRSNYVKDPKILELCAEEAAKDADADVHGNFFWIVLGNGSLYNKMSQPNTNCRFDFQKGYLDITANRKITKGAIITVAPFARHVQPVVSNNSPVVHSEPEQSDEEFMEEMKKLMYNV